MSREKQLQAWFSGPRARLLVQREEMLLREVLSLLVGFRLLQVGEWGFGPDLLAHAATLCQWRLARWPCRGGDIGFDGVNLPLASGGVDALLLAHSLDMSAHPHRLLRECERVLNDRGQLIVLGFNPWSMWALTRRLPLRGNAGFGRHPRFYGARRVCDWLRLLGFDPERVVRYGAGLPFFSHAVRVPAAEGRHRTMAVAWLAQAYMIVARKRVVRLTPIRWRGSRIARPVSGEIGLANHGARRLDCRS